MISTVVRHSEWKTAVCDVFFRSFFPRDHGERDPDAPQSEDKQFSQKKSFKDGEVRFCATRIMYGWFLELP
jgi:hypothetical protein